MISFLSIVAEPAVSQSIEKDRLDKPYMSLGRLFNTVGLWVYQQGGALGYALKDEPMLLGKLLGILPEHAVKTINNLREAVSPKLSEAMNGGKDFFHLYTVRELRLLGIEMTACPPNKALHDKFPDEQVFTVMNVSFWEGAALGYHFPDIFREYWENTYRARPDAEWENLCKMEIVSGEPRVRLLEEAIAELAEMAVGWGTKEAPELLESHELEILGKLAKPDDDTGAPGRTIENEHAYTIPDEERLNALIDHIVISSALATKPINEQWTDVAGAKPVSWLSNWIVQGEMLFFFLHVADRCAFEIGGLELRDSLMEKVVYKAITGLVNSSCATPQAKKGLDVEEGKGQAMNEALDNFVVSNDEYSSCEKLFDAGPTGAANEETIAGKMAAIINRTAFDNQLITEKFDLALRQLVWNAALKGLAESGLKKRVEETCKSIQPEQP